MFSACICTVNNNTFLPVAVQIARGPPAFPTEAFYFLSCGFTCAGIFNQKLLIFITSERHYFGDGCEQCLLSGIAQARCSEEFVVYIIGLHSRFPHTVPHPSSNPTARPEGTLPPREFVWVWLDRYNIITNRAVTAKLASQWRYTLLHGIASWGSSDKYL